MRGGIRWLTILIHFIICLTTLSTDSKMVVKGSSWNQTDRLALLAFKAKIVDDPFGMMSLWNDSAHICQWYGVKCGTRHQRVTQLNLISLKLGGSISPHIGNLSFLHVLQLQNNSFVSEIPTEIGRLRRLQVLILTNNTLGGEIPLNLSSCLELRILMLINNKLEGEIPLELGFLSKLQSFGASKNNLAGVIPPHFGNLTFLEDLSLTYNNLVGKIPQTLGTLNYLRILYLAFNNLKGEVPSSLYNISSMEEIDVGFNQLGGRLPGYLFHTLANLQYLSVGGNKFSGQIPSSLSNASNLEALQLSVNNFTGKVPSLESLTKLGAFLIDDNGLGSGPGAQDDLSFLCSLTNATTLYLLQMGTNNFGGVFPRCITNLSSQLTFMSIGSNFISGSIPQGIDNLIGVESLSISENSFTGSIPPTIGNLVNLVELYLDINSFSGLIPSSLGNLSNLIQIDLSSNSLEGTIPSSLQNCTSLQALGLNHNNLIGSIPSQVLTIPSLSLYLLVSHNQLTGSVPEEIGKLTNLYQLDISANKLSGEIPDSLAECTTLQYLYLDGNNFQGPIPSSLSSLKGLQRLDLSSNNFSGKIPEFLASLGLIMLNISYNDLEGAVPTRGVFTNATATSLKGNNKLCGGIIEFRLPECSKFLPERKKRRLSVKMKVTIASTIAGVALLILLLLQSVSRLRRKQRQSGEEPAVSSLENPPLKFVSYGDVYRATNGFSDGNLVGTGSFGHVYRGILHEGGQVVAVKVLNLRELGASKSFIAECEALRNIRHKNLVKLLTVCSGVDYQGNDFKALVYDFMPNGSLQDWLHPPATREDEVVDDQQDTSPAKLDLLKRLSIAIDVAYALEYVHHEFGTPLVHCDIKPSNILVDADLSGHISNFGLAKFLSDVGTIRNSVHPSSSIGVRGTIGYTPPEYGLGGEVSTQGDVYSYGILLLEMFTGKRPTHEMFKEGLSLHLYAKMALSTGVVDILDPILCHLLETEEQVLNPRRSVRVMDCLVSVIETGIACSLESPSERMDMSMVTAQLRRIRETLSRGRN